MLLKFYHDSLQYFLFQSRVYIYIWPSDFEDGEFLYFVIDFIVIINRNLAGS